MNKILLSLTLLSAAAVSLYSAEKTETPSIRKEMSFRQMMSAAFNPEKAGGIQTAKLVYAASSTDFPDAILMFRARKTGFIRIDIVTTDNHYIICQDGTQYWGYDKKNGAAPLTKDEILELKSSFSFLPVPFYISSAFSKLTYKGKAMYRTTNCLCYKVDTGSSLKMEVWLEEKNGLLCKVNASDSEGRYATAYRDYRDFDGIKIATAIILSNPTGSMTMQLRSVDWNTSMPEKLFTKGTVVHENAIELFQKELIANDANAKALKAAAKAKKAEVKKQQEAAVKKAAADKAKSRAEAQERSRQWNINRLEREIRVLTIEIEEKSERLKKVEDFANSTRKDAAAVATATNGGRYYSTWRYGYGYRKSSSGTAKRAARKLGKASAEAVDEYNSLSQELMEKRIQLSDAKVALAKLKNQK